MSETFSCALCGFATEQAWTEPVPASVTEPHHDPRDGLMCLRSQLDREDTDSVE